MTVLLVILVAIIVGAVLWLFTQSADYEVVRRRVINVSPDKVYPYVADLKHWEEWSPWLMHEPTSTLEYGESTTEQGGWYSWLGEYIGSGKMTHKSLVENESIEQALEFYKPMKSKSEVYWRFNPVAEGTEVTWGMRGRMPFLFRWMSGMMDQWVGKDYEIGLGRLAMVSGDMSEPFEIAFPGNVDVQPEEYLAAHFAGSIDDMKAVMEEAFPRVVAVANEHDMQPNGQPFTLYHDFDKKKNEVICDIAVPVAALKEVDGYITGSILGQKYMRTSFKGDYSHLEMAWHSAFSHSRMFKQKVIMGKPMVERYVTDPSTSQGLDLVTYIDLPVK